MPKNFFQMIPTTQYDVDGDGTSKMAVDVLRRVKLRTASLADSAIFYNYPIQDGDTAEIIADKYYGSSKYHWVVMLMNSFLDHTYDFTLHDVNFEAYMKDKYGSLERSKGVTKNLNSFAVGTSGLAAYKIELGGTPRVNITAEWWDAEKRTGASPRTPTGANPHYYELQSGQELLRSGTIPGGHSTGIYIKSKKGENPWGSNIGVGDKINIFIPEHWYDKSFGSVHSGTLAEPPEDELHTHTSTFLQADTASSINGWYEGGLITITGEGSGTTGVTGNTRTISTYNGTTKEITWITGPFADTAGDLGNLPTSEWTYSISYDTPAGYSIIPYTYSAEIIAMSERIGYLDPTDEETGDDTLSHSYFYLNTNLNSNSYDNFVWNANNDLISVQTGIHHFEMDIIDDASGATLAENLLISQDVYVNTSVGTASTKRIVYNYDYEDEQNENKRVIYLLKKEYLSEFIEEFEALVNVGE